MRKIKAIALSLHSFPNAIALDYSRQQTGDRTFTLRAIALYYSR
ncbi:MAG: hypothetical protein AB1589_06045 [Cyanobacteriota bacterium]